MFVDMDMKYYKINWTHNFDEEPILFLIEIDGYGFECKKIEKYKDGNLQFASEEFEKGTFLSPDIFSIEDYNYESSIEKIFAEEISRKEFYHEWNKLFKS